MSTKLESAEIIYLRKILYSHIKNLESTAHYDDAAHTKNINYSKNIAKKLSKFGDPVEEPAILALNSIITCDEIHFLSKGTLQGKLAVQPPLLST